MRIPKEFKILLRWWQHWLDARRWLCGDDPALVAARCVYRLNLAAREKAVITGDIYALKSAFISHLWETGRCASVSLQRQMLKCWNCGGAGRAPDYYGDYEDDECWKCGGSGIYKIHHLYRFAFDVAGRRFVWHQPAALVRFLEPIAAFVARDGGDYVPVNGGSPLTVDREMLELYYVTAWEYLRQRGAAGDSKSLRPTLRQIWKQMCWHDRRLRRLRDSWRRAGELAQAVATYLKTGEFYLEPEIPF